MTIAERIAELDRLYLFADQATWTWIRALGNKSSLDEQQRTAWSAYYRLRDSDDGLPEEMVAKRREIRETLHFEI